MSASQQPDAEHAPLTSPAAAGSGSTGHDKAAQAVAATIRNSLDLRGIELTWSDVRAAASAAVDVLHAHDRAALAAGDANVAEALDVPSLLAAVKAEALRDAADKWQQGDWIMVLPASLGPKVIGLGQRVTDWLRAQADRAEA